MKYTWILFDADDTLFDFGRSARHALALTLAFFDIKSQPAYFTIYEQINHEVWSALERREITAVELRKIRFERFLQAIGEYRDPMEMNAHYLWELSRTGYLVDGAEALLLALRAQNRRTGLITNGLKEVQRPRIAEAGMVGHFDVIVVSDEIGVSKPYAGFFEHAFVEMGHPEKAEVLVVGDSLQSDIQGGNLFGLDTCWFNPRNAANLSPHQPTYQIQRLSDIWSVIGAAPPNGPFPLG